MEEQMTQQILSIMDVAHGITILPNTFRVAQPKSQYLRSIIILYDLASQQYSAISLWNQVKMLLYNIMMIPHFGYDKQ